MRHCQFSPGRVTRSMVWEEAAFSRRQNGHGSRCNRTLKTKISGSSPHSRWEMDCIVFSAVHYCSKTVLITAGQIPGCLSKSKSLSGSKSNCILQRCSQRLSLLYCLSVYFSCGKKSTKRTGPAAWPLASLAQTLFFGAGRNSPASRCSNSLPAFSRKKHLRSAALQWAGPAVDAPTWCIKKFVSSETTWFSVLFPIVNSYGYKA